MGFLTNFILDQVHNHNKNYMIAWVGACGSGKSYSALDLGRKLDENFSIERVVFSASDFIKLVDSDLPTGSVIIWDEAGTGIYSRNFWSEANKAITLVTQTFRHKNLICIFTVPSFDFLDKHVRELFNLCLVTTAIDKKKRICFHKPLFVQNNPQIGKIYSKYKNSLTAMGRSKVKRIFTNMPKLKLRNDYEKKKTAYTSSLNKKAKDSVEINNTIGGNTKLTGRQKQVYELLKTMSVVEVARHLEVCEGVIRNHKQKIEDKGYYINRNIKKASTRAVGSKYRLCGIPQKPNIPNNINDYGGGKKFEVEN